MPVCPSAAQSGPQQALQGNWLHFGSMLLPETEMQGGRDSQPGPSAMESSHPAEGLTSQRTPGQGKSTCRRAVPVPALGKREKRSRMSSWLPVSSSRSASSRMKYLTALRLSLPLSTRSLIRPAQHASHVLFPYTVRVTFLTYHKMSCSLESCQRAEAGNATISLSYLLNEGAESSCLCQHPILRPGKRAVTHQESQ
jgi:hypothetical protein